MSVSHGPVGAVTHLAKCGLQLTVQMCLRNYIYVGTVSFYAVVGQVSDVLSETT